MVEYCKKCGRRNVVGYHVEPGEAVVQATLNRWKPICPACFDVEAQKSGVRYSFVSVSATSWSDQPVPKSRYGRSWRR